MRHYFKEQFGKDIIAILLATFFMTVLFDLVVAIEIGIALAAFLIMKIMSDVAEVKVRNMDATALQAFRSLIRRRPDFPGSDTGDKVC